MAVGQGSIFGGLSYLAIGRETTYGTGVTTTAGLDFMSSSLKIVKENKILEQIATSREYGKRISLGRVVEGEVEMYFQPELTGSAYLLQSAMGGATITSATATGETAGGLAFTHTFTIGDYSHSYKGLSINLRKGDSASAKIFEYVGARVNECTFSAEIDEALKCSIGLIAKDVSATSNDVSSALTLSAGLPLSFVNGRISVESTFASLTASSYWHVQSVEFGIANSLKSESEARRIGSDTLDVLPLGISSYTLNMTIRFDTTTAYAAMLNATQYSVELEFQGTTLTTSAIKRGLKIQMPVCYISEAGDPEIGGPDEILTSEISFHVLRDVSSATGYAVKAFLTNNIASY